MKDVTDSFRAPEFRPRSRMARVATFQTYLGATLNQKGKFYVVNETMHG